MAVERLDPQIWFGRPGSLVSLPPPEPGYTNALVRPRAVQNTIGGGRSVNASGYGRRQWTLAWSGLPEDDFYLLEEFNTGARGVGPFAFYDPSLRNKAWPNQSSGSDVLGDTTGYDVWGTGETLTATTAFTANRRRSVAWSLPANPDGGYCNLTTPWPQVGDGQWPWPVIPGVQVAAAIMARATVATTANLFIAWVGADDTTTITSDYGPTVTIPTTGFSQLTAAATPPAGAKWAYVAVDAGAGNITTARTIYLGAYQLEYGVPAVGSLVPGTGFSMVSIADFSASSPQYGRWDVSMTLLEVGGNA